MRSQDIAFDRKVRKVAREIAESITALPTTWTAADVVAIWRARTESLQLLSYAYVDLDATYIVPPDLAERLDDVLSVVRGIGNNLNQLARHSNEMRAFMHTHEVQLQLKRMDDMVRQFVAMPERAG